MDLCCVVGLMFFDELEVMFSFDCFYLSVFGYCCIVEVLFFVVCWVVEVVVSLCCL